MTRSDVLRTATRSLPVNNIVFDEQIPDDYEEIDNTSELSLQLFHIDDNSINLRSATNCLPVRRRGKKITHGNLRINYHYHKSSYDKKMCLQHVGRHNGVLVAVVAFGELSARNISHVLCRLRVNYKIVLPNEIPTFQPTHIILSGGSKHVYEYDHYPLPEWVINSNVPVLGICYGMQLIVHTFGGIVIRMPKKEHGPVEITELLYGDKLLQQVTSYRWMNRHDQVISIPNTFDITAVTKDNHIAAFTDHKRWWAVQYHPESQRCGTLHLFRTFLRNSSFQDSPLYI